MATLGRLKRGSVQIQRAAIKATGRIGARTIMTALVIWALVLQGLVQHSPSVVLMALSTPLSSEEFAEYVAKTSYVSRYCRSSNDSEEVDGEEGSAALPPAGDPELYDDSALSPASANGSFAPVHRPSWAEPALEVPLSALVRVAGRDWLSYVLTCASVLWFLAWLRLVRDCPAAHPRVSDEQRLRLHAAIGPAVAAPAEVAPLPWRHMLLSSPVWACAVANLGSQWGQAALHLAVTKYLKLVYGFALTYDRVLSVLPHVGHCMAALLFGRLADHVRSSALVSTTTARRLLVYTSHFPAGAILFVVGYSGCDPAAPAALYTAAVVISGAAAAGVHASAMDLAPNYAGTVFGLSQTLGAAGGLAGSYVVTEALHGSLPRSWRLVFGVAALVLGLTAMAFLGFGSGSVQPWNAGAPGAAPAADDVPLPVVEVTPPEDDRDPEAGAGAGAGLAADQQKQVASEDASTDKAVCSSLPYGNEGAIPISSTVLEESTSRVDENAPGD